MIVLQAGQIANPPYSIVDGQVELWHNPQLQKL
jgi:hypothetical protein